MSETTERRKPVLCKFSNSNEKIKYFKRRIENEGKGEGCYIFNNEQEK